MQSIPVADWSAVDCADFLRDCASKLKTPLREEKLRQYIESFKENDIMGFHLAAEDDSSWSTLISSSGFKFFVKEMLKLKIKGKLDILILFSSLICYQICRIYGSRV